MKKYTFESIDVGLKESFSVKIDRKSISSFSELSGDRNPIHLNEDYAKSKNFKGQVAFGMLTSSYLSALAGMYLPGLKSIILSVNITFNNPVYVNDTISINGEVIEKKSFAKIIKLAFIIKNQDGVIVSKGEMLIKVNE
jgi:acyl dehydratase